MCSSLHLTKLRRAKAKGFSTDRHLEALKEIMCTVLFLIYAKDEKVFDISQSLLIPVLSPAQGAFPSTGTPQKTL